MRAGAGASSRDPHRPTGFTHDEREDTRTGDPTFTRASAVCVSSTEGDDLFSPKDSLRTAADTFSVSADEQDKGSPEGVEVTGGRHPRHFSTAAEPPLVEAMEEEEDVRAEPSLPFDVAVLLFSTALTQSFSATCITLLINMDMQMGPVQVTHYWMYVGLSSWFQPLVGWLSDTFVVLGERRRPLFVVAVLANAVIFLVFTTSRKVTQDYVVFVVISIISQMFTTGTYIPLNGLLVEVGKSESETGEEGVARMRTIMSKTMTIRSIGSLCSSLIQMCLLLFLSVHVLLGVCALMFVLLAVIMMHLSSSYFTQEPPPPVATDSPDGPAAAPKRCEHALQTCNKIKNSCDIHDVHSDGFSFIIVLAFVFLYTAMPDGSSVYANYLFAAYSFPAWYHSMNGLASALGATIGAYVFSVWMSNRAKYEAQHAGPVRTSMFSIFVLGSIVWALAYLTNLMLCTGFVTETLGIPVTVFVPVDSFVVSMCVRFAFMPTIIMASEHAPKHFEATAFEVFSVASIGGGTLSAALTGLIAMRMGINRENYSRLWELLLISIVCKLVPIPFAYVLPKRRDHAPATYSAVSSEEPVSDPAGAAAATDRDETPESAGAARGHDAQEREDIRAVKDSFEEQLPPPVEAPQRWEHR